VRVSARVAWELQADFGVFRGVCGYLYGAAGSRAERITHYEYRCTRPVLTQSFFPIPAAHFTVEVATNAPKHTEIRL